jgi:hypothetical protein
VCPSLHALRYTYWSSERLSERYELTYDLAWYPTIVVRMQSRTVPSVGVREVGDNTVLGTLSSTLVRSLLEVDELTLSVTL